MANDRKRARVEVAKAWIVSYLRRTACQDCGVDEIAVLEFDHIGAKRAEICSLVGAGIGVEQLAREVERCDVVCANCHRRRTAERAGWRRTQPGPPRPTIGRHRSGARARNVAFAYEVLRRSGCVDCGERDICVLDFDHVDGKTATVMRLAWNEVSLRRLQTEIDRCEVRCVNCHRRRTAAQEGYYRAAA